MSRNRISLAIKFQSLKGGWEALCRDGIRGSSKYFILYFQVIETLQKLKCNDFTLLKAEWFFHFSLIFQQSCEAGVHEVH